MKRLWIAASLLLFMCCTALFNAYYCQQLSDSLSGRLEQAQTMVEQGQWNRAKELTQQVYQDWQDRHFYLHVVMRHSDTDQILRSFQAVLQYLELQELDQYAAANADLSTQIRLLAEMEQASLVNVL